MNARPTIYMSEFELLRSVATGTRIARQLNPRPNADAAIRHALVTTGREWATRIACDILQVTEREASDVIQRLVTTRPVDIVSPTWED